MHTVNLVMTVIGWWTVIGIAGAAFWAAIAHFDDVQDPF